MSSGEKRYIVNSKWWRDWEDYVGMEDDHDQNEYGSDFAPARSEYRHPGKIKNISLMVEGKSMQIKDNMLEDHDFKSLPQQAWKYIQSWYGADLSALRFMYFNCETKCWKLDLNLRSTQPRQKNNNDHYFAVASEKKPNTKRDPAV